MMGKIQFICFWMLLLCVSAWAGKPIAISSDPYSNPESQHKTEVEPSSFAYGLKMVSAFQVGRTKFGGSSNIGWSTFEIETNTWKSGFLPGITKVQGGPFDLASDASVAYDSAHDIWLISYLTITLSNEPLPGDPGVFASRSTDGGLTWGSPIPVTQAGSNDKNWTVCDNGKASRYFGHCYTQWDDMDGHIWISTSTNGGLSWRPSKTSQDVKPGVVGGQPVVQPDGTIVVPILSSEDGAIIAISSKDGGETWSKSYVVATQIKHTVSGLRAPPLPSAQVGSDGTIYLVWQDCRYKSQCSANDILMTTSRDGENWSPVTRIPLDGTLLSADHFTPAIGVDPGTSGSNTHLVITYYTYPKSDCAPATCELHVAAVGSRDGGATWSMPEDLMGPMYLSWFAQTFAGAMYGDYISVSFLFGTPYPFFVGATEPSIHQSPQGQGFNQSVYTIDGGLKLFNGSNDSDPDSG